MKLIIIFGPHAVGKMTVGQELSKITGIPLFHNHQSIELALSLLGNDTNHWKSLSEELRELVFKHVSDRQGSGLIFTFMWALDAEDDHAYINRLETLFKNKKAQVYYVELCAKKEERIIRNQSEHRLLEKPSKRNLPNSFKRMEEIESKYILNTNETYQIEKENYIKIDNTSIPKEEVAKMIKERFNL